MVTRRDFLKLTGATAGTAAVTAVGGDAFADHHALDPDRFGVLTDTTLCIGCRKCEEACNEANRLPRPDEPFDDRDARWFADPTVSRPDVPTFAPPLETTAPELPALVRDHIAGMTAVCASGSVEETLHLDRRGALRKDRESHADPGKLIDRHGNPPAERPSLRCRERKPRHPESGAGRYGREVHVECVTRIPSHDTTTASRTRFLGVLVRRFLFPDDSVNRRRAEMQPRSSQHLCHAYSTDRREQHLPLPDEIPNEVRITVDGPDGLNQISLTVLVDATHPDLQRLQVKQKDPGGLLQGPTSGGTKLQDSHALRWGVVRPPTRMGSFPTSILDR